MRKIAKLGIKPLLCCKTVAGSKNRTQKKATGSREAPLSLLSVGEETEGEALGNIENDSDGEIWEEDSFVDIDNSLGPEMVVGCGIARLGVPERPIVITRSERAVKTSHLIK